MAKPAKPAKSSKVSASKASPFGGKLTRNKGKKGKLIKSSNNGTPGPPA